MDILEVLDGTVWTQTKEAKLSYIFLIVSVLIKVVGAVLLEFNSLEQQWVCLCSTAGNTGNKHDGPWRSAILAILDNLDN